ncbi:MAG: hypothetical protein U1E18_12465 [Brevundimonas sp.]|uniref:hypothetical protein n=1 Tax=Brevundimonas sp. TaxID=1871086 RepID=UPI002AB97245|nr:hypothetical protein [Brevundimonas sp.]MDZ4110395.1 hypothetical protein [Brevundimonas sp.]
MSQKPSTPGVADFAANAPLFTILTSLFGIVGALFTLRDKVQKRLIRVEDALHGGGTFGAGFNLVYRLPQWINGAIAGFVLLAAVAFALWVLAAFLNWLPPDWPSTPVPPALYFFVVIGALSAIWLDLLSRLVQIIAQALTWLGRVLGLLPALPIALEHAQHLLSKDGASTPIAFRRALAVNLAAAAIGHAANNPNRAADPQSPKDQLANLALITCAIESFIHKTNGAQPKSWTAFYAAVDSANLNAKFADPEVLREWGQTSFLEHIRGPLNEALAANSEAPLPSQGTAELESSLRVMVQALKKVGGDVTEIAGRPKRPSLDRAMRWLAKYPSILGPGGMTMQFFKLAQRWRAWPNAELVWLGFPRSLNIAALMLNRGVLSTVPDVDRFDFLTPYQTRVLASAQMAVAAEAEKFLRENPQGEDTKALQPKLSGLTGNDLRWRIADEIDTALWSLARQKPAAGDKPDWKVVNNTSVTKA